MVKNSAMQPFGKLSIIYFFCSLGLSCTKNENSDTAAGCISRYVATTASTMLDQSQVDSADQLFSANNMPSASLQFLYYEPNIFSSGIYPQQTQVWANVFINGLPVFDYNEVFIFFENKFDTAYLYSGRPVNNDTSGHQSLVALRTSFLQHAQQSVIQGPLLNSKPFIPPRKSYLNDCLTATLGYLDAADIPGSNALWGKTVVKIWAVHPGSPSTTNPMVYVEDDNGLAWGVPTYFP